MGTPSGHADAKPYNLRLEVGHHLEPTPLHTTEFATALPQEQAEATPASGYARSQVALPWKAGRFSGRDFVLQPDGILHCPAGKTLHPTEQRREADGSLRVLYAARITDCRPCPLREHCQWHGSHTTKPRRVSLLLHPLSVGSALLLWRDWSRRAHQRAYMQLLRHQRMDVTLEQAQPQPAPSPPILSRAQRAHYRLSFAERWARNARAPTAGRVTISLFGLPASFATWLSLATA